MRYELFYTEGKPRMRGMKRGNDINKLLSFVLNLSDVHEWEIFKNTGNFHSTTQTEYLVTWFSADGESYMSNVAKSDASVMAKKFDPRKGLRGLKGEGKLKMSEIAVKYLRRLDESESVDVSKMKSDIILQWTDVKVVKSDLLVYLVSKYRADGVDDYEIEDIIKSIENAIREFRKVTRI